jgi:TFIIF-interacting CTD phosphatase-like protein
MKTVNVVLDLDNTLISSVSNDEERAHSKVITDRMSSFDWRNMEDTYKIFARPHLQEFLDFVFANFNVSVWTAASKSYAIFIVDEFILSRASRNLDYLLFSHHCRESHRHRSCQKSLNMLGTLYPLDYDPNETYIIDDHKEVYATQPTNCIRIKPFEIVKSSAVGDTELLKVVEKLKKVLALKTG